MLYEKREYYWIEKGKTIMQKIFCKKYKKYATCLKNAVCVLAA
jgi:hypothetical protein